MRGFPPHLRKRGTSLLRPELQCGGTSPPLLAVHESVHWPHPPQHVALSGVVVYRNVALRPNKNKYLSTAGVAELDERMIYPSIRQFFYVL